jgi:acyl-homoserine lactone synthase
MQLNLMVTPPDIAPDQGKENIVAVTAAFDSGTPARIRNVRADDRPAVMERPAFDRVVA